MTFPRAEQVLDVLREQFIDEARPCIWRAIDELREEVAREDQFDPRCLEVALHSFVVGICAQYGDRIADPPLRQMFCDMLVAAVVKALRGDHPAAATLQ